MKNIRKMLSTAAAAALLSVSASAVFAHEANVKCYGANHCQGKSSCKTHANTSCKTQNSCKGKGMMMTKTDKECTDMGGSLTDNTTANK